MDKTPDKFQKLLTSVKDKTSLYKAFNDGFTPDDVKAGVVEILSPYFSNKSILDKMAVNYLMADVIEYVRLSGIEVPFQAFEYSYSVHLASKAKNEISCITACAEWLSDIYDGLSVFWSQAHLELDKTDLDIEEFLHECLINIGSIIEGAINPILRELLHQNRIERSKETTSDIIRKLDFGNVVNELYEFSPNKEIFSPGGIRLNQWRNIAYHHKAKVHENEIICFIGKVGKEQTVNFSRNQFYDAIKLLYDIFSSFKLANSLFTTDNIETIDSNNLFPANLKIRTEMNVLNIVVSMASQGFEVIEYISDKKNAKLVIRDITDQDPNSRRFHTVQFVGILWQYTHANSVTVEYLEKNGTANFRTTAHSELFERIERDGLPRVTLAEEAELTDLKCDRRLVD
jgi:hypothetical protein